MPHANPCASGATLLAILAVAMWNNHLEGELDDQDVDSWTRISTGSLSGSRYDLV